MTAAELKEAEAMKIQKQKEREEKEKLKAQLEANKKVNKEKECIASKAKKLNTGKPNVNRYKDIGVDLSSQGG